MKKSLICIGCPLGCIINAVLKNGQVTSVEGQTCKNGAEYAKQELTNPTRTVTSTIKIKGGDVPMVSVKTIRNIPKEKIFDCIAALKNLEVKAPVEVGTVMLSNVAGTGIDVVATKCVNRV